jgi:urease accessory protein
LQAGAKIVALDGGPVAGRAPGQGGVVPLQRCRGTVRLAFARRGARTIAAEIHQSGSLRVRFPRSEIAGGTEAVLINTSGGMTDGDVQQVEIAWGDGASATVTTQAAERIYRSRGPASEIATTLRVGAGATAFWLPQETILFDESRLERRNDVEIVAGGALVACESLVFGRAAMGETVQQGAILDRWSVRYDGRLAFLDGFRLDGPIAELLARPAVAGGHRAMATILAAGPDAEARLACLRDASADLAVPVGSTRLGPVVVTRLLAPGLQSLHGALVRLLGALLETVETSAPRRMPTVWAL